MFGFLTAIGVFTGITSCVEIIKEKTEPVAPPIENFALYQDDIISGVDSKTLHRNQLNGKYKKPSWADKEIDYTDFDGLRFQQDSLKYGYAQATKWAKQGKYKWKNKYYK